MRSSSWRTAAPDLADTDGAYGIIRYAHLARANSAAARNAGLALARGRFLLLTDADCVARPDWIEKLTGRPGRRRRAPPRAGRSASISRRTWAQRHAITVVDGQRKLSYLPALHLPYVAGANAGFVTSALREAGGFDERCCRATTWTSATSSACAATGSASPRTL